MNSFGRIRWNLGYLVRMGRVLSLAGSLSGGSIAYAHGLRPNTTVQLFSATHPAMATTFSLYMYVHSQAEADRDAQLVFQEIDRVEELLSNYRESSELSRINREAGVSPVTTDPETFHFLETSLLWSARSDGAFDITVGKLMKVWGFFGAKGRVPSDSDLSKVSREVGWREIELKGAARTVRFRKPGLELDPGGIGKGYAVERAVKILRSAHVGAALVSAGSSTIYALGAPPGELGWKINVPALSSPENTLSTVVLADTSLSTANCTEKHFVNNGHLYCHIMNPKTLRPVEGVLQVTVIAPSATDSDALSNVLFVMGAKGGASVLQTLPKDSALILSGEQPSIKCDLIGWKASLNPGYCSTTNLLREATNESQALSSAALHEPAVCKDAN